MAIICPKCGREFLGQRDICPVCGCATVDEVGIDNSEAARKQRLQQLQTPKKEQQNREQSQIRQQQSTQKSNASTSDSNPVQAKIIIKEDITVKIIGIILIVVGILGIFMGMMMFGDIGIACLVGAITALLSGIAC
ncbi:MAG: hypothetical protein K2P30_13155, partial [Lachnospiraceae bacterium]|nr:hypothetical protein [Lachnospiraceae bacterium]